MQIQFLEVDLKYKDSAESLYTEVCFKISNDLMFNKNVAYLSF